MIPNTVVMIRPAAFGFNPETAVNNAFQHNIKLFNARQIQDIALLEFDSMVHILREKGIEVIVFQDNKEDQTPDSIFPNNWFSTFTDELILYSMFTPNRRRERKSRVFETLSKQIGKPINDDLLSLESENEILEGTGSLVCDHANKVAYAAISPRTHHKALDLFEKISGYSTVRFDAYGPDGNLIYHTNVMLTIGDNFAVIGTDSIAESQRQSVLQSLRDGGKRIIELSNDQVYKHFAGNMLQLSNKFGDKFLVMSAEAFFSLDPEQKDQIMKLNNEIISPAVHMIETIGGGSVRCMMAEVY